MIQYQFTRCDLEKDPATNKIVGAAIGLTANSTTDLGPISAYTDARITLEPKDAYTAQELRTICMREALNRDWYNSLERDLETQAHMPIPGPTVII